MTASFDGPFSRSRPRLRSRSASSWAPVLMAGLALAASCRCGASVQTPVVLRVSNDTSGPLFVDDSAGRLGVELQRASGLGGEFSTFDEEPCPCRLCDDVCGASCECSDAGAFVRRIEAGSTVERTWNGSLGVPDVRQCGRTLTDCVSSEQALTNETYRARWCFATQAAGFLLTDGGRAEGELPVLGRTCVDRDFRPADGVVELRPVRGAACTASGDCTGKDELCLAGSCTAGCPASDVPSSGAEWSLVIASPDDRGFFEWSARDGGTQATGEGVLSAVSFQGGTLNLQLRNSVAGQEHRTGALSVRLPLAAGLGLRAGDPVSVLLLQAATTGAGGSRALVLREPSSRAVLFAADMGQGAPLLGPVELAPFSVSEGASPFACRFDACGRLLFYPALFDAGVAATSVEPGASVEWSGPLGVYRFLSVLQGRYAASTRCAVSAFGAWALWQTSPAQ